MGYMYLIRVMHISLLMLQYLAIQAATLRQIRALSLLLLFLRTNFFQKISFSRKLLLLNYPWTFPA